MGPVVEDSSAEAGGASNTAALKANSQEATAAGASTPAPDPGKATEAGDSSFIVNLVFPDPTDPVQLQVRQHLWQPWSCSHSLSDNHPARRYKLKRREKTTKTE